MNNYLFMLGNNLPDIRRILGLTQEDLAEKMGVSRPTIVKIEKDPSKLSKALAFALYGAVTIEIKSRIKAVELLDPQQYNTPEKIGEFVHDLKTTSTITPTNLGKIATMGLGSIIPNIGGLISSGMKGLNSLKDTAFSKVKSSSQWDEEKARILITSVQKKLKKDEHEILNKFNIASFDIEQFGAEIEKGNEEDYDLWP